ncbi:MAG: NupC/NupG family nucleoside CNT transporter [Planctomycetota bacterium]|jgi:CNT family concentrative nucleoside transporter
MDIYNLVSFTGIFVLMGAAWVLSRHRKRMNLRCIAWGVGIQLALGALVFHAPGSRRFFQWLNDAVLQLLAAAQSGQEFLFGPLANAETAGGFVLAIQALPVIIFFSALMGLLYYTRIMPLIVRGFAFLFTRLMRISGAESLCAASNIFVGIESVTTVRPFLQRMTRSEFCTILTVGMATVASSTLAVYVGFLHETFEGIAGHLISASILSAPAGIVISKILYPEDGEPLTLGKSVRPQLPRESGAIEAIVAGAMAGVKLVVGICALLIAFLGLIALVDLTVGGLGGLFGIELSLGRLLGYVFRPLAAVIGVPWADSQLAGEMLGKRLVATEIPGYLQLADAMKTGKFAHPRSAVVIAYSLCGFAHVASLAIFVGGTAALVPERRKDLAEVGLRALLAATLACLMTGAVAGTFFVK